MGKEIEVHLEAVVVANMMLTKHLLTFIAAKKLLDDEELQAVFVRAVRDMVRSTLPISEEDAKQTLSLFLAGTGISQADIFGTDA